MSATRRGVVAGVALAGAGMEAALVLHGVKARAEGLARSRSPRTAA